MGLGRAQKLDGTVAVTYLGPEQAVLPCAQFTPSGRCSPVAEKFTSFIPDRAAGIWFGLTGKMMAQVKEL